MGEEMKGQGIPTNAACSYLGVSRSWFYGSKNPRSSSENKRADKDEAILNKIKELKAEHPFWGYRRVWAWLKHRERLAVNRKRVYRLMKKQRLLVDVKHYKANRTPQRSKPRAERPNQFWGVDMTKFLVAGIGWVYLIVVLDWYTKKIVGRELSLRCRSEEWKRAIAMALNNEFPEGVRGKGLKLISDNGSQPTSASFMKEMSVLDIDQIFTSYDNPKGNADTERVMRTIKEEIVWVNEFTSFAEAKDKVYHWIDNDYNKLYVHSSLGYLSPCEFESLFFNKQVPEAA